MRVRVPLIDSGCGAQTKLAVHMQRLLITLGGALILLGLVWPWIKKVPLFHLPGDIVIDRPGFRFFFPITTMLLISVVVSLVAWALRK